MDLDDMRMAKDTQTLEAPETLTEKSSQSADLTTFMRTIIRFRPQMPEIRTTQLVDALQAAIRLRDPDTARHQSRTGYLCAMMAERLSMSDDDIAEAALAGYIHDVGKLTTPLSILLKQGALTEHEFEVIRRHPIEGYRMVADVDLSPDVKAAILYHHERLDGSGYPFGLVGSDQSVLVRIVAIADIIDAVTNHRPYRRAMTSEETIDLLLQDRGVRLDHEVIDAAISLLRESYPAIFRFK